MDQKHQALVDQVNRISPLNPVMLDLLAALQNEDSQASDLKRIIESDANTSATILKIANSPFYGMSGRIHSIQDACVLLGYDQLKNIIYATALDHATNKGPHVKWRHALRNHTIATAIICNELGGRDMTAGGKGYASGLLHELGKQIMLAEFPDEFNEYMSVTDSDQVSSFMELFAEVGDVLAKRWRLPDSLRACIRYHRKPEQAPAEFSAIVNLVANAHNIANEQGYPSPGELPVRREEPAEGEATTDSLLPSIRQRLDDELGHATEAASC